MENILLKTGKIILSSPIPISSAEELAEAANDPHIKEMIGSHSFPYPYTKHDAVNFIEMNRMDGSKPFTIDFEIRYDGSFAGVIGLRDINFTDRKAHIGYWVYEKLRRKGIATESVKLLCEYADSKMGMHRLYTEVFTNNAGSVKVLLNSGFQIEGVARNDFLYNGEYRDSFHFARIFSGKGI